MRTDRGRAGAAPAPAPPRDRGRHPAWREGAPPSRRQAIMSTSRTPAAAEPAGVDVHLWRWRADRLAGAGFRRHLAGRIGADPVYDVHALIELCERGSPPDLACRILAPLDAPL